MVLGAGLVAACSLITTAYDFQVGTPPADAGPEPDSGPSDTICMCIGHPEYARVPCAAAGEAGASADAGTQTTRYYVVDSVQLGARRADWTDAAYSVGFNQDCANRNAGEPATCTRQLPGPPMPTLPRGIENAFATQLLAPLGDLSDAGDLEDRVNAWIAQGLGGFVIFVDGWNGEKDDPAVSLRIGQVIGKAGAPIVGKIGGASVDGYVTGGRLVATFGSQQDFPLGAPGVGGIFKAQLFSGVFAGEISEQSLGNIVIAGSLVNGGQLGPDAPQRIAELVLGCSAADDAGRDRADRIIKGAFDLHVLPGTPCSGMSFAFVARTSALTSAPSITGGALPPSCSPPPPPPDSGADAGDATMD